MFLLFSRLPGGNIAVQSIVRRNKITVVGDRTSTMKQLASSVCEGDVLSAVLEFHDGEDVVPKEENRLLSVLGT